MAADASLTDACVMSQRVLCEGLLPAKGYSSPKATQCLNAVQEAYKDVRASPHRDRYRAAPRRALQSLDQGPASRR